MRDDHALPPDFLGQARLGERNAVLDQHLRRIEIGAELEGDGDRHPPVAGRLRRLVEHVVDAVDLLLDRRGDRVGDGLGRRARIGGADRHRRRDDVRELRDRQPDIGERADDRDDDRDDAGKDRASDEEVAEVAWGAPRLAGAPGSPGDALGDAGCGSLGAMPAGDADLRHARLHLGPGMANWTPWTTTRSARVSPERMTRRSPTNGPSLDRLGGDRVVTCRPSARSCAPGRCGSLRRGRARRRRRAAIGEAHVAEHAGRQEHSRGSAPRRARGSFPNSG